MSANLEDIVSLCKRRGFIYQGSEVYGGLAGTWDYGPLGVALKRNIMDLWWKTFVLDREDMYPVDAAILMNQKVWQASGHADTFTDPLIQCKSCNNQFRVDKIIDDLKKLQSFIDAIGNYLLEEIGENTQRIEEYSEIVNKINNIEKDLSDFIDREKFRDDFRNHLGVFRVKKDTSENYGKLFNDAKKLQGPIIQYYFDLEQKCPVCGQKEWSEPKQFNMMFKTNVGPIQDDNSISYLRPETAQGIFTNYKNVVDSFYPNIPFGIAQQGKAFRNEISPRDFVFRSREFEQMEIEYFIHPDSWQVEFDKWVNDIHEFLEKLGLPKEKVHELEVPEEDRAHYSKRTIDFEFDFPHKRDELLGLAYRTDFDLGNIQRASGKNMEYRPKDGSEPFLPHVIEPSFGVERAIIAVLSSAYTEDEVNGEKRVYLDLPEQLAPIKYAVCPLARNKEELVSKAREIYEGLRKKYGSVLWIDSGNIGKNYRKMDEIGVPKVVTVDFESLEDDTVTVRDRNTTEQKRIKISDLA